MIATHQEQPVRVRFAPSPTGPLHIGSVRTVLFNWLFARQKNGAFIVRIEDTDVSRSAKKYEAEILTGLEWLGLTWDEGPLSHSAAYKGAYGPYRQSERLTIYKKYLTQLLAEKKAYICYCTKEELEAERQTMLSQGLPPKYSGHCRTLIKPPKGKTPQLTRFKVPESRVEFKDIIRGKVSFDASLFGDIAIARSLAAPFYNFAVVVDDELMEITHVIRGEDHISNTPKQILLQHALGFREPIYAHLPLILASDRSKLSKRFAESSLVEYREKGYLPEAIVNFLAFLGWHPKDNREIFTLNELIQEFDLRRVQKAGAVFDEEKLDWLNKEHIKRLDIDELTHRLTPFLKAHALNPPADLLRKVAEVERERLKTFGEFPTLAGFFFALPDYNPELLVWEKKSKEEIKVILQKILERIRASESETFTRETLGQALESLILEKGRGAVLWPLRVAVSGEKASPDPLEIIEILGRKESERRIELAIQKIEKFVH